MNDLFLALQSALAGEYSIERELGRGGMGIVYLAREVRLTREVAIKVLPPELGKSPRMRERFVREAQTAARLSHPNIVPIHRVDEAHGFVFFVMAYVKGETLAQRIRTRGPLPPHTATRILREVAWALTYAHSTGIVHRDIKAENILIEEGTERALVTDFGIAGAMRVDARDDDGLIAGSAHYASPEHIAGQPLDAASDLYSLGVAGFFALTGRLPFDGPTTQDVVAMQLNARPPAVTSLAPTTPVKLSHVIERCLAKRSEHRYPTAAAFAEALDQAIEPPRDIPPPIRVWLNQTNHYERPRTQALLGLMLGGLAGLPIAAASHSAVAGLSIAFASLIGIGVLPSVARMQRVLREGYGRDDLLAGIKDYWRRRREELAYEQHIETSNRVLNWICVGSLATAVLVNLASPRGGTIVGGIVFVMSVTAGVGSGLMRLGRHLSGRSNDLVGESQIRFFSGKWGERWIRLCSVGVKPKAGAASLPQLTEVALGRATDALYDALPKDVRKQLKKLPATVRRLEDDAKTLRAEIDRLDTSIAQLDGDARGAIPSSIADTDHEAKIRADRDRLRVDLRHVRRRADERLAATVAALENIRLDLLRLQLGDGNVNSVTASLEAAQNVATDLSDYVAATHEVDDVLSQSK